MDGCMNLLAKPLFTCSNERIPYSPSSIKHLSPSLTLVNQPTNHRSPIKHAAQNPNLSLYLLHRSKQRGGRTSFSNETSSPHPPNQTPPIHNNNNNNNNPSSSVRLLRLSSHLTSPKNTQKQLRRTPRRLPFPSEPNTTSTSTSHPIPSNPSPPSTHRSVALRSDREKSSATDNPSRASE